ncbi:transposase [Umezawaea beigongshangensis]|uniref:transposase n=1 Tax=Umezawaea beigongshangensis TaxID=2780383 RepID=UPI001E5DB1D8|nr:transposase [Umezawaea beigongshangensis]
MAHVLADLPVTVLVRMRSDRVLRRAAPQHPPGTTGRPRRHGDTAASSPSVPPAPGANRASTPGPRPGSTTRPASGRGIACTPG